MLIKKVVATQQTTVTNCPGGGGGGGGSGDGSGGGGGDGQETLTYATDTVEEAEVEVDEIKMEAEDHLAREYVQEFVLDHLDPADVKREVSARMLRDLCFERNRLVSRGRIFDSIISFFTYR